MGLLLLPDDFVSVLYFKQGKLLQSAIAAHCRKFVNKKPGAAFLLLGDQSILCSRNAGILFLTADLAERKAPDSPK
jgi:hypothetical protein